MAYPTVSAPYGFKPVNLIGGQVFSGSTRMYPIAYNYATPLFYGDCVTLTAGYITQVAASNYNNPGAKGTVGVFLGCYYTNPTTKQRLYSQFYPGNITAGDITAVVCDDPDTVFKAVAVTGATTSVVASISSLLVGANVNGTTTPTGNANTGNSVGGLVAVSATAGTTGVPFRILELVQDTQIETSCTYSAGTGSASIAVTGLPVGLFIPVGTDLFLLNTNGQLSYTGSTVATAQTTTSSSATLAVTGTPTVSGTVVLVQSPEALVKFNFGVHNYYAA